MVSGSCARPQGCAHPLGMTRVAVARRRLCAATEGATMLARTLLLALAIGVLAEAAVLCTLLVRARRRRRGVDAFRCRTREPDRRPGRLGIGRRSRRGWASWAHAVLVVRTGRLGRTDVLPVRFPEGSVMQVAPKAAKGLGPSPVVVHLRLEDDRLIEIAAAGEARDLVAGPFLAACVLAPER